MKNSTKIIIVLIAILLVVAIVAAVTLSNKKDVITGKGLEISSVEELNDFVIKIYEGADKDLLPLLETTPVDVTESDMVSMLTGLENGENLEYLVVSQPLMSAQAYSLVIAKVKNGIDSNSVAKTMSENVDMRRWICVEAEQLYATSSGDIVFLVMASKEQAQFVFNNFKSEAGTIGEVYEKEAEEIELPPDMLF